jgi:3-dehydroquinate synthase
MSRQEIEYKLNGTSFTRIILDDDHSSIHDTFSKDSTIFLVDERFFSLYSDWFDGKNWIKIPPGEMGKSWAMVEQIFQQLLEKKADAKTRLIGVGGGVVTDLTGFVAAVYKRGIPHSFIPTTLVSMVDAALGGKNGVNLGELKNMAGSIKQPDCIWICPKWLQTLALTEWQQGFAEIIKHGLIRDLTLVEWLEKQTLNSIITDPSSWFDLIQRNVRLKMELVQADESDRGLRRMLNFGHSIGHAIEKTHQLTHGEAVSIGMNLESQIAVSMGLLDPEIPLRIQQLLNQYQLPVQQAINADRCWQSLLQDKKRSNDAITWIVPAPIGNASLHQIPLEIVKVHFDKIVRGC